MKKIVMVAGVVALAGMMSGCAMIKEMRERQAREEAARKAEMAEKGPVRYWMEKNATPEQLAAADRARVNDPDLRSILSYSVASYKAAVASLAKVQVVQDGVAVWERAKAKHSEAIKKEIKDFTAEDLKAAYALVTDAKEKEALTTYLNWGKALEAQAVQAARDRNAKFVKMLAELTIKANRLSQKYKKDVFKMAVAIADGMNALSYLGKAGEASQIEADVMAAGRDAASHLQ
jgi:hypothetical protein